MPMKYPDNERVKNPVQPVQESQGMAGSGPCRESVASIVSRQVEQLARELNGWRYLLECMEHVPMDSAQEEALYEILSRARRERSLY